MVIIGVPARNACGGLLLLLLLDIWGSLLGAEPQIITPNISNIAPRITVILPQDY